MKKRIALQSIGNLPQADMNDSRKDDSVKCEDASSIHELRLRAIELLELEINKTRSMTNDEQLEYLSVLKRLRTFFTSKRDELLKAIESSGAQKLPQRSNGNQAKSFVESESIDSGGGPSALHLNEKVLQLAQCEESDETEELPSISGGSLEEVIPDSQPDDIYDNPSKLSSPIIPLKRKVEYNAADYETPRRQNKHLNDEAYSSASKWPPISPEDALEHMIDADNPFIRHDCVMTTPVPLKGTSKYHQTIIPKTEKKNSMDMVSTSPAEKDDFNHFSQEKSSTSTSTTSVQQRILWSKQRLLSPKEDDTILTLSDGKEKMTPTFYDNVRRGIREVAPLTHVELDLRMDELGYNLKSRPQSRDDPILDLGLHKNLEKINKVNLESIETCIETDNDKNQVKDTSVNLSVSKTSASHEHDSHEGLKRCTSSLSTSSKTTVAGPTESNDQSRNSPLIDPAQIATLNYPSKISSEHGLSPSPLYCSSVIRFPGRLSPSRTPQVPPFPNASYSVTGHLELPPSLLPDSPPTVKSKPNPQALSHTPIDPDSTVLIDSPAIFPKGDSHEGFAMVCLPQGEKILAVVCGNMIGPNGPNGKTRIAVLTEFFIRVWAADFEAVGEKNAWTCDSTIKRQQDTNGYLDDMTCLSFNADDTALFITERVRNPTAGNSRTYYCEDHFTISDMSKDPALVISFSSEVSAESVENIDKSPLRMVLGSGYDDFGIVTLGQSSRGGVDVVKFAGLGSNEKLVARTPLPLDTTCKFLISRALVSLCNVKNQPGLVIGTFDDFLTIWNVTTIELLSVIHPNYLPSPLISFQSSLSCIAAIVPKVYIDQIQSPQNSVDSHPPILGIMARLRKKIEGEHIIPAGPGLEMITIKSNGNGVSSGYEGSDGALFEEVVVSERFVAGSVAGKGVGIWDKPSGKMQSFLKFDIEEDSWKPFKMAIHPLGSYVVTGDEDGCIHLYFDDNF